MKVIDYDTLLQSHKRSGHLSADANVIANRLIRDMHIQNGSGLARFLEVEICFDNHRALRVWVQRQLDTTHNQAIILMICAISLSVNYMENYRSIMVINQENVMTDYSDMGL